MRFELMASRVLTVMYLVHCGSGIVIVVVRGMLRSTEAVRAPRDGYFVRSLQALTHVSFWEIVLRILRGADRREMQFLQHRHTLLARSVNLGSCRDLARQRMIYTTRSWGMQRRYSGSGGRNGSSGSTIPYQTTCCVRLVGC